MVNYAYKNRQAARQLGRVIEYSDTWDAKTCTASGATTGNGSPTAGAIFGRVWTIRDENNIPVQAYNKARVGTFSIGANVKVGQRIGSSELDIIEVDFARNVQDFSPAVADAFGAGPPVAPELNQSLLRIQNDFNLRPYTSSGLVLRARAGWLGGLYWDDTLTIDLDSHKTSTADRWAWVVAYIYDNAGTLAWDAVTGSDLTSATKTTADIEAAVALVPAGGFPIVAVLLKDDATTMNVNDANSAEDVRNTWSFGGGGSGIVESVVGGKFIDVDDTDPENPIVNLDATVTTSSSTTGTVNNLSLSSALVHTYLWNAGSTITITGVKNGEDGNILIIVNQSTGAGVVLSHQSGSSDADARFINASGTGLTLQPQMSAIYRYVGASSRWQMVYGNIHAAQIFAGTLAVARGGTSANLSATGGAGQYLKQSSVGGAVTVGTIPDADVPNLNASKINAGTFDRARIPDPAHARALGGRLSLVSGNPSLANTSGAGTLYCTPGPHGNRISLWDGTQFVDQAFSEFSISLSGLNANTMHTVYAYLNSGTPTLELEAWSTANGSITGATNATPIVVTSNSHGLSAGDIVRIQGVVGNTAANGTWYVSAVTANTFTLGGSSGNAAYTSGGTWRRMNESRTTAVAWQNGLRVKSGDATRLYLGDILMSDTSGQCDHNDARRGLYNHYNRIPTQLARFDLSAAFTYNAATFRYYNNDPANNVLMMVCGEPQIITIAHGGIVRASAAGTAGVMAVGFSRSDTGAITDLRNANTQDIGASVPRTFSTPTGFGFYSLLMLGNATNAPTFSRGFIMIQAEM